LILKEYNAIADAGRKLSEVLYKYWIWKAKNKRHISYDIFVRTFDFEWDERYFEIFSLLQWNRQFI